MIEINCPKGSGKAAFIVDYGLEGQILWVIFLDNGEIWTYPNHQVRLKQNITAGRVYENYNKPDPSTTVNDFNIERSTKKD